MIRLLVSLLLVVLLLILPVRVWAAGPPDLTPQFAGAIDTVQLPPVGYAHLYPVLSGWALNCWTAQIPKLRVVVTDIYGGLRYFEEGYGLHINPKRNRPDVLAALAPYCAGLSPIALTSPYLGVDVSLTQPWLLPTGTYTAWLELSDPTVGTGAAYLPFTITR